MSEPYGESARPPRKLTLNDRISQSRTAIQIIGAFAIGFFFIFVAALVELPGLLVLHLLSSPLCGTDRLVMAAFLSVAVFFLFFLVYLIFGVVYDAAYDVGAKLLSFLNKKKES